MQSLDWAVGGLLRNRIVEPRGRDLSGPVPWRWHIRAHPMARVSLHNRLCLNNFGRSSYWEPGSRLFLSLFFLLPIRPLGSLPIPDPTSANNRPGQTQSLFRKQLLPRRYRPVSDKRIQVRSEFSTGLDLARPLFWPPRALSSRSANDMWSSAKRAQARVFSGFSRTACCKLSRAPSRSKFACCA